jgi:uncharacterized protein (TIGR00369 family)
VPDEPRVFALGCEFLDQLSHRHVDVDGEFGVEIDVTDDMRGPAGSVHGGLVSMLVDVAAASSVARATGRPVATASTSIQYLAAGRVGPLRATGTLLRASEALGVVDVKVVDMGRDERLLAAAHVTLRFLSGEGYVRQT